MNNIWTQEKIGSFCMFFFFLFFIFYLFEIQSNDVWWPDSCEIGVSAKLNLWVDRNIIGGLICTE